MLHLGHYALNCVIETKKDLQALLVDIGILKISHEERGLIDLKEALILEHDLDLALKLSINLPLLLLEFVSLNNMRFPIAWN